ncbi:MAG: ferredoxin:thioredoxin reductase [Spirochaetae bacterium HGW-Spirochaetae-3]|jgi:ferredoxin-thioredoxin reductase catalytic subunit|nr:MAG: ferredoxin:thioredoxin reductase [Spirochaetae bacterium HGW-Spirochaetae-3]
MEKSIDDTRRFASMVSTKQGWELNPDAEFTESLLEGLTVNWNRYGYFLCPCRDSEGSREADSSVICPCAFAKPDVAEHGHCYCALYLKTGFTASGGVPGGIPDRRFS